MTDSDAIAARQREYAEADRVRAARQREYREGDRVRAVNFVLDEGLRIWPIQNQHLGTARENWRVVRVADQRVTETLAVGPFHRCQADFPDALPGVNDNESVPPGTEGTVVSVDDGGTVHVRWDNDRHIGVTVYDTLEKL
jgi:hypothetical protein